MPVGIKLIALWQRLPVLMVIALASNFLFSSVPARASLDEDGMAFSARVCALYDAPTTATFVGGGAGCTWRFGEGERGYTSTEIVMYVDRNAAPAAIEAVVQGYEVTLLEGFANMMGYRTEKFSPICGNWSSAGRMIFWGEPYSGNITGYALCGDNLLMGEIHYPPGNGGEMEILYKKLMQSMVPLLSAK